MFLDGRSLQEYPVHAGVSQGYIPGAALFLLNINEFCDDVTCNKPIYANDNIILYAVGVIRADFWQQLEFFSKA